MTGNNNYGSCRTLSVDMMRIPTSPRQRGSRSVMLLRCILFLVFCFQTSCAWIVTPLQSSKISKNPRTQVISVLRPQKTNSMICLNESSSSTIDDASEIIQGIQEQQLQESSP